MKQPNNLRNRYRRCMECHASMGWAPSSLREWVNSSRKDSYSAIPGQPNEEVKLVKAYKTSFGNQLRERVRKGG